MELPVVDLTIQVPDMVLIKVLEILPLPDLGAASRVCRRWEELAGLRHLWRGQKGVFSAVETLEAMVEAAGCEGSLSLVLRSGAPGDHEKGEVHFLEDGALKVEVAAPLLGAAVLRSAVGRSLQELRVLEVAEGQGFQLPALPGQPAMRQPEPQPEPQPLPQEEPWWVPPPQSEHVAELWAAIAAVASLQRLELCVSATGALARQHFSWPAPLPQLRSLQLQETAGPAGLAAWGDGAVPPVCAAFREVVVAHRSQLESLRLYGHRLAPLLGEVTAPLCTVAVAGVVGTPVHLARQPELQELRLETIGAPSYLEVAALLGSPGMPHLRALTILSGIACDPVVRALTSGHLSGLTSLSLMMPPQTLLVFAAAMASASMPALRTLVLRPAPVPEALLALAAAKSSLPALRHLVLPGKLCHAGHAAFVYGPAGVPGIVPVVHAAHGGAFAHGGHGMFWPRGPAAAAAIPHHWAALQHARPVRPAAAVGPHSECRMPALRRLCVEVPDLHVRAQACGCDAPPAAAPGAPVAPAAAPAAGSRLLARHPRGPCSLCEEAKTAHGWERALGAPPTAILYEKV